MPSVSRANSNRYLFDHQTLMRSQFFAPMWKLCKHNCGSYNRTNDSHLLCLYYFTGSWSGCVCSKNVWINWLRIVGALFENCSLRSFMALWFCDRVWISGVWWHERYSTALSIFRWFSFVIVSMYNCVCIITIRNVIEAQDEQYKCQDEMRIWSWRRERRGALQ